MSFGSASAIPIKIQRGRDVSVSMNIDPTHQPTRPTMSAFATELTK